MSTSTHNEPLANPLPANPAKGATPSPLYCDAAHQVIKHLDSFREILRFLGTNTALYKCIETIPDLKLRRTIQYTRLYLEDFKEFERQIKAMHDANQPPPEPVYLGCGVSLQQFELMYKKLPDKERLFRVVVPCLKEIQGWFREETVIYSRDILNYLPSEHTRVLNYELVDDAETYKMRITVYMYSYIWLATQPSNEIAVEMWLYVLKAHEINVIYGLFISVKVYSWIKRSERYRWIEQDVFDKQTVQEAFDEITDSIEHKLKINALTKDTFQQHPLIAIFIKFGIFGIDDYTVSIIGHSLTLHELVVCLHHFKADNFKEFESFLKNVRFYGYHGRDFHADSIEILRLLGLGDRKDMEEMIAKYFPSSMK